ncbi:uncharacterized protein [Ptychodera flava]|uniref:uncharacterized protein n=1 Tax=Ptychodera flava TaxID=63121 RepID=UPI00396A190B
MQRDEYMQQYQNAGKVVSTQLSEINTLKTQLKEKEKVIIGLRTQLEQVSDAQSDIELLKKLAEERQLDETTVTSGMDEKEVTGTSADDENIKPKITEIEKEVAQQPKMTSREESEMETATSTQPEMTGRGGSGLETATSTQPEMTGRDRSEMETATPTQPEMAVREGSEMETATSTQAEMTGREGSEMETATPTQSELTGTEGHGIKTKKITTVTEHQKGRWSRRTLKGHQGHKFKDVRGLAFHNDKLLVCDKDNNIVHILNQDYTCEKEFGSFSGQFDKPFEPWSIAVSQDNHYFILDKSNVQIVVCDQNNKVIRIISLPADSDPRCVALVKGFVIVTEVKGHRVLKYSQNGQYIAEIGGTVMALHNSDCPTLSLSTVGMSSWCLPVGITASSVLILSSIACTNMVNTVPAMVSSTFHTALPLMVLTMFMFVITSMTGFQCGIDGPGSWP